MIDSGMKLPCRIAVMIETVIFVWHLNDLIISCITCVAGMIFFCFIISVKLSQNVSGKASSWVELILRIMRLITSGSKSDAELSLEDFESEGSFNNSLFVTSVSSFSVSAILSKACLVFCCAETKPISAFPSQSIEIGAGGNGAVGGFWICAVCTDADQSRPAVDLSVAIGVDGTNTLDVAHRKNKTQRRCSQALWPSAGMSRS